MFSAPPDINVTALGGGVFALHGTPQTQQWSGSSTEVMVTKELTVTPGQLGGTSPGKKVKITAPPSLQPDTAVQTQVGTLLVYPHDPTGAWGHPGQYVFKLPGDGSGPTPPVTSGWYNVHSTRVDWHAVAQRVAEGLWQTPPIPVVGININPNPDLVNLPAWFSLSGYHNETLTPSLHMNLPWTLYYTVDVTTTTVGPCPDDPTQSCSQSETHPEEHQIPHLDTLDVGLDFNPVSYQWDFGDGRPGSQAPFDARDGIGTPYTNPNTPSPVTWNYQWDSRDFVGGFPITATLTWSVAAHVHKASDVDGSSDETFGMPNRNVSWFTRLVVCQIQVLRIAPGSDLPSVPCSDPRSGS
jgi:hypothetical protein